MANEVQLRVNGRTWRVAVPPETPLLYVLTNDLALQGPRFGCGLGQCGCCSVLADGVEIRSCITPTSRVVAR
jgi:nicotinate dehydrogenase subunit A